MRSPRLTSSPACVAPLRDGIPTVMLVLVASGCAFVELEPAPYAPRQLSVVYSIQEDLTFLGWQLERSADADAVTFELAGEDGVLRPIELAAAPFPAPPRACGRATCFQYQVPGHFVPPADLPLLRATHPRFGEFAGPEGSLVEVAETFSIDPIAVDRNARADPRRFDYFAEEGIPLVRDYGFRLVRGECAAPSAQPELAPMEGIVELPDGWSAPSCFEAAPLRADAPGVLAQVPLVASAETWLAVRQRYDAPSIAHTTLYGVLFDLAVPDPTRCAEVRDTIADRIGAAIGGRDASAVSLGTFEPDDAPDCAASPPALYPVARMLALAQDAALGTDGPRTILWIAVSNRSEPSPAFDAAWAELLAGSASIEPSPVYAWFITSSVSGGRDGGGAQWVTPYRPIEDPTLLDDIDTVAALAAPFRTLDHDLDTSIALELGALSRPQYGRICQAVPALATLEALGAPIDDTFAWPPRDAPLYTVDLGVQIGVPSSLYVPRSSEVLFEVCARFCDGPFRGANGADHESWLEATECAGHP